MPSGIEYQAQGSNAANPDNAEADARRQQEPVEPPVREPIGREADGANNVEQPVPMESLHHDNEVPHSNGHPSMQGFDDEQVSAPQPDLGLQALSVNPPIQIIVRSDLQNRVDARVSSLSVEVFHAGAMPVPAPSPVVPEVILQPLQVEAPDPAPAPVPAPAPAPAPVPAPDPGVVPTMPSAPAAAAHFGDNHDDSMTDAVEEGVSSLSSETSTSTSSDSSDEDNYPLAFFNRGHFPRNGKVILGSTGRQPMTQTSPMARRFQSTRMQPLQMPRMPPPSRRAQSLAEDWVTEDESSDSATEPSSPKRRRQMDRRE